MCVCGGGDREGRRSAFKHYLSHPPPPPIQLNPVANAKFQTFSADARFMQMINRSQTSLDGRQR